ncbi:MAG: hypothetical protein A2X19_07470 [Bacteroidetes bacterium GWE2_39_28]|nr:MAG: hypothetical protein A2X19_07470 [Bacteroidetes bacterium GWE2_39_28]OFY12664.1 MAG: hypothetical protein A2X16_02910 [Bacteroidetes bacterium GWF2_39_10]OFZ10122.1 MAG: hypothetical protein A2465_10135 [Bacteroidetes bacterium RIFOXYC2_FULL_39_11]HCT94620.1 hypothetical protein [Rikenellaceae bacterium]
MGASDKKKKKLFAPISGIASLMLGVPWGGASDKKKKKLFAFCKIFFYFSFPLSSLLGREEK